MSADQPDKMEEVRQRSRNAFVNLKDGQADEALRYFQELHSLDPSASHIMTLGVTYLWLEDYEAAWKHFQNAIRTSRYSMAGYNSMAGIAAWCAGDRKQAVKQWRAGIDCDYADSAGGVRNPLLLFCAYVLEPELVSAAEAAELLTIRADDPRVKNWPGPVAEFVLGRIDEVGLRAKCVGVQESGTVLRHWFADFYVALLAKVRGTSMDFKSAMRKLVDAVLADSALENQLFPNALWDAELFIARREAA